MLNMARAARGTGRHRINLMDHTASASGCQSEEKIRAHCCAASTRSFLPFPYTVPTLVDGCCRSECGAVLWLPQLGNTWDFVQKHTMRLLSQGAL